MKIKKTKKIILFISLFCLIFGNIYGASSIVDSTSSSLINIEEGLDISQEKQTEYDTKIEDGETKTEVYVSQASTFAAIIPKNIILNGENGEGLYVVQAKGNIGGLEEIRIVPEYAFLLSDVKHIKHDIPAWVEQDKVIFKYVDVKDDILSQSNGRVYVNDLSAGNWVGSFNFNISLYSFKPGELVISTNAMPNITSLAVGIDETVQLYASVNGNDVSESIKWESDNENISVIDGNIVIGTEAQNGDKATITALGTTTQTISTNNDSLFDKLFIFNDVYAEDLTYVAPKSFVVEVVDMKLNVSELDMIVDETQTIIANISEVDGQQIKWTSNTKNGIELTQINNSVIVKAKNLSPIESPYIVTAKYGDIERKVIIRVIEHVHDYILIEDIPDTNMEHGYKKYVCDICKEELIIENTEPLKIEEGLERVSITKNVTNMVMSSGERLVFDTNLEAATYNLIENNGNVELLGHVVNIKESATTKDMFTLNITNETTTQVINIYVEPKVVDNAYYIYDGYDLLQFSKIYNLSIETTKNATLQNDIDLSNVCGENIGNWTPIGSNTGNYIGIFDGNNYAIKNMYINEAASYKGLFYVIQKNGVVKNLQMYGTIKGYSYVGSIAGVSYGKIENCHNYVEITGINSGSNIPQMVGGIVGENWATVDKCSNFANIESVLKVGGIAGRNFGVIQLSFNKGTITSRYTTYTWAHVGGIAGQIVDSPKTYVPFSVIQYCYNTGEIKANGNSPYEIGGIVGASNEYYGGKSTVQYSYNTGTITAGTYRVGEIIGCANNHNLTKNIITSVSRPVTGGQLGNCIFTGNVRYTPDNLKIEFSLLGNNFKSDVYGVNNGFPILNWQDPTLISSDVKTIVLQQGEVRPLNSLILNATYSLEDNSNIVLVGNEIQVLDAATSTDKSTLTITNGTSTQTIDIYVAPKYENGAYQIKNVSDFVLFRDLFNAGYLKEANLSLNTDIDLSSVCGKDVGNWIPIGNSGKQYNFVFEGNGYKISNLYANYTTGENNIALIGSLGPNGKLNNLTIDSGDIKGTTYIAAFVGTNNGTIFNCHNKANVTGIYYGTTKATNTGGIVGWNNGSISQTSNGGNITGVINVGGIAGINVGGLFESFNSGQIKTTYTSNSWAHVGGIAGQMKALKSGVYIKDCYNIGTVSATSTKPFEIGGIVGIINSNSSSLKSSISNCYSVGTIIAGSYRVGEVVGLIKYSNATNLFYTNSAYGIRYNEGGSTIKNTYQVSENSLKANVSLLGESFSYDNKMINNGYPVLIWQQ